MVILAQQNKWQCTRNNGQLIKRPIKFDFTKKKKKKNIQRKYVGQKRNHEIEHYTSIKLYTL